MWEIFRWMLWPLQAFATALLYIIGYLLCIFVGIGTGCDQVILRDPHKPQWPPLHPHAQLDPDAAVEEAGTGVSAVNGYDPSPLPSHQPHSVPMVPSVPISTSPLATNPPVTSSDPSTPPASSEIHSPPDTAAQPTTPALPPGASPPMLYPPTYNATSAEPYTMNEDSLQAAPEPTSETLPAPQDIPQGHPLGIGQPSTLSGNASRPSSQRPTSAPRAPGSAGSPTFGRPQSMRPAAFQPPMESSVPPFASRPSVPEIPHQPDLPTRVSSDVAIRSLKNQHRTASVGQLGHTRRSAIEEWTRTVASGDAATDPNPVLVQLPATIPLTVNTSLPLKTENPLSNEAGTPSQDLEPEYTDTRTFVQRSRDRLVGRPDAPDLQSVTHPSFSPSRIPPSLMGRSQGGWGPRQPPVPTLGLTTPEAAQAEFPVTVEPPVEVPPTRATRRELAWHATHYGRRMGAMLPGPPMIGPYLIDGRPVPTTPFSGQNPLVTNPPSAARVPDIEQGESESRPAIITNQTGRVVLRRVGGIADIRATLGGETRHQVDAPVPARSRALPRRATAPPLHDPILDTSPSPDSNGQGSSRSQSLPVFGSEDYSDERLRMAIITGGRLPSTPRDILPRPPSGEEQGGRSRAPRRPRAPTFRQDSEPPSEPASETPIEFIGGQFSDPAGDPSPSPAQIPAPDAKPTQHLHLNGDSRKHSPVRPPLHELPMGPFEEYLFGETAMRTASPRPTMELPVRPYEEWVINDDSYVPDIFDIGELPLSGSPSSTRSRPLTSSQPHTGRGRERVYREGRERIPMDRQIPPASNVVRPPDLAIPQFGQAGPSHWAGAFDGGDDLSEDSTRFDPSPIEASYGHSPPMRNTLGNGLFGAYVSYRQRTGRSPPGFIPRQRTGMTDTTTTTSTAIDSVESVLGEESDDELSGSGPRGGLVSTRNSSTEARENIPIDSSYRDAVLATPESRIVSSAAGDVENIPPSTERPVHLRYPIPVRAYQTSLSLIVDSQERYRTPPMTNLNVDQASHSPGPTQLQPTSQPAQDESSFSPDIDTSIDTLAVAPAEAEVRIPSVAIQSVEAKTPSPSSSVHEFTSTSQPRIVLEEATPELSYAEFGDTYSPDSSPGEGQASTQFLEHVDTTAAIPIPPRAGRYLLYDPGEGPDTDSDYEQGSSDESAPLFTARFSESPMDVATYPLDEGEEDPLPPGNPFIDTPDVIATPPKSRTPSPVPLAPPMILGQTTILAQRPRVSRNSSEESTKSRVSVQAVGE